MTTTTLAPEPATPAGRNPETVRRRERAVPAPIPFGRIAGIELRKMFDTRSGFWLMASLVVLSLAATVVTIIFVDADNLDYEGFASAWGMPMSVVLPMIAVLAVTSEWSARSALTTFTLVPARGRVIAAKALVTAVVGVVAIAVALFAPMPLPLFSGFTYFLMGPSHWAFGASVGRRRKAVENRLAPVVGV
jgi:hypothetical protein